MGDKEGFGVRVGVADFATEAAVTADARNLFLAVMDEVAPDVRQSLWEGPGAQFRTLAHPPLKWPIASGGDLTRLHDDLLIWADAWHLQTPWMLHVAVRTLHLLKRDLPGWAPIAWTHGPATLPSEHEIAFHANGWDPASLVESRGEATARLVAQFRAFLKDHFDRLESKATERGMVRTKLKRGAQQGRYGKPGRRGLTDSISDLAALLSQRADTQEHDDNAGDGGPYHQFGFFVEFQVQGRTIAAIAEAHNTSRENVRDRLKEIADLIALPLRPHSGGRPRR